MVIGTIGNLTCIGCSFNLGRIIVFLFRSHMQLEESVALEGSAALEVQYNYLKQSSQGISLKVPI